MSMWSNEDISSILMQLNDMHLPFGAYEFVLSENGINMIGKGGFSYVYEMKERDKDKKRYALKVIGFKDKRIDPKEFSSIIRAQLDIQISLQGDYLVKIYDSLQLKIWIKGENTVEKTEKIVDYDELIKNDEKQKDEGDYLIVQFVLMEKLTPVLIKEGINSFTLKPHVLNEPYEKEVLKLASEIGKAIWAAHEINILHRDLKIENIFYSEEKRCYKLGDFGISKRTEIGIADTKAFTEGYGAPELINELEDNYDYTADIYSFGIVLFVLMNGMKFPGSDSYQVKPLIQYSKGYVLPKPDNCSDELAYVIGKMTAYDPSERYRSMEKVLNDLDAVAFGTSIHYQLIHKDTLMAMGLMLAVIGIITFKLAFFKEGILDLSVWTYIFLGLCLGRGIMLPFERKTFFVSLVIFGLGLYLLISNGLSIPVIIAFLIMLVWKSTSGIVGGGVFIWQIVGVLTPFLRPEHADLSNMGWIPVTCLILSLMLMDDFESYRRKNLTDNYIDKNFKNERNWRAKMWIWLGIIAFGLLLNKSPDYTDLIAILKKLPLYIVGLVGSAFWLIRWLKNYSPRDLWINFLEYINKLKTRIR